MVPSSRSNHLDLSIFGFVSLFTAASIVNLTSGYFVLGSNIAFSIYLTAGLLLQLLISLNFYNGRSNNLF